MLILVILELRMEDLLHLSKWKKPVYTNGNVGKDTKKHELRKKNFRKIQKLKLHKLISLNLHHLCGTFTILIWGWFSKFTTVKWVFLKQFWYVSCSRKIKRVGFSNPRVKKWILTSKDKSFIRVSVWKGCCGWLNTSIWLLFHTKLCMRVSLPCFGWKITH